jgi:hypothetical protein
VLLQNPHRRNLRQTKTFARYFPRIPTPCSTCFRYNPQALRIVAPYVPPMISLARRLRPSGDIRPPPSLPAVAFGCNNRGCSETPSIARSQEDP